MSDLKPCPFCGINPEAMDGYTLPGHKEDCPLMNIEIEVEAWNTRHKRPDKSASREQAHESKAEEPAIEPDMVLVPREPSEKELNRFRSLVHAMGWNTVLFGVGDMELIYKAIVSGIWRVRPLLPTVGVAKAYSKQLSVEEMQSIVDNHTAEERE